MKNSVKTVSSHPHCRLLMWTFRIVVFLLISAGLSTGFAANVLTDPGFEDGGGAWSMNTWAGTSQLDTTVAHSGVNSWKFNGDQTDPAAWNGGRQLNVPADATKFYQYSAWVNVPGANSGANKFGFTFRHNVGAGGVDLGYTQITAPGWTQVKGPYLMGPAGGTFGYVGFHSMDIQLPFYIDDLAVEDSDPLTLQGRVVDNLGAGVDGAAVTASSAGWTTPSTTTAGGGYYTLSVPPGSYTVGASFPGLKGSTTVTVSASPTTAANIVLAVDPDYDTDLLFSVRSSAYVAGGNWPLAYPAGQNLVKIGGAPSTTTINGQKWEMNHRSSFDAFQFNGPDADGSWANPIPVNGASIVAVVRPLRNGIADGWNSVVDIFYQCLVLCVRNDNGAIQVRRNGDPLQTGPAIPNGQITVLSLVVQSDGAYKVYANGTQVMDIAADGLGMTALTPGPEPFKNYINIGRNQPDAWPTFNGNIGDVYVYKVPLDDTKRTALETSLTTKFGTAGIYAISSSVTGGTGGTISPLGTVNVPLGLDQTYTITPAPGYEIQDVLVDSVSVGTPSSYTFMNVTAAHTIAATFRSLPAQPVSGTVNNGTAGIPGATVFFSASPNASVAPAFTTTTLASPAGSYSLALPIGTWYACAAAPGYAPSADITITVTGTTTGQNITLAANGRNIPAQEKLLFAVLADSLPASGPTGNWPCFLPVGISLAAIGSPEAVVIDGAKWEQNVALTYNPEFWEADGFRFGGSQPAPIACNGASIVVAVKPVRNVTNTGWTSIVDLFYNRLVLGIINDTGKICVWRNGTLVNTGPEIPDGQKTILSLVVQPTGQYKVWANGVEVMNDTGTSDMTSLVPGTEGFQKFINVGRNNPDGWTTYNGNIGDVLVYKTALNTAEREALQTDIAAKFGIVLPVFVSISGKVTLPDGTTPVAGATVTATGTETFTALSAADGTYSVSVLGGSSPVNYSVSATKASYTVSTPQSVNVTTSGVLGVNLQISLINAIQGYVKKSDGSPIPNAVVQVGTGGPAAVTGADGKYVVTSIGTGPGVAFYADALGFADYNETIDTSAAASGVITKGDIVLTPKTETDYTYIQNGGFESGLTPWVRNYGTPEVGVTTDAAASGSYSGYWKSTTTAWYDGYLAQVVPVVEGSTYNIYFKLKTAAPIGQCGFDFLGVNAVSGDLESLEWWGYAGGLMASGENWMYQTVPNVWEQALNYRSWNDVSHLTCVRVTPPFGAVSIQLIMGLGATAVGQTLLVDDVVIDRVGPIAPPLTPIMTMPGGLPTFKFQTLAGHRYRIVYKDDLKDPSWITIAGADWTQGTGLEAEVIDTSSPLPGTRYYRLEIQ